MSNQLNDVQKAAVVAVVEVTEMETIEPDGIMVDEEEALDMIATLLEEAD